MDRKDHRQAELALYQLQAPDDLPQPLPAVKVLLSVGSDRKILLGRSSLLSRAAIPKESTRDIP